MNEIPVQNQLAKRKRVAKRREAVFARHGGLCAVPGCSQAAQHEHHIEFRSQGGTDEVTNLIALCASHHLRCVHTGRLIVRGREGQYRVRLMDNLGGSDCAYPGVELLPDGPFVTTTYGHWIEGEEPFIVSVRFKLEELDARLK